MRWFDLSRWWDRQKNDSVRGDRRRRQSGRSTRARRGKAAQQPESLESRLVLSTSFVTNAQGTIQVSSLMPMVKLGNSVYFYGQGQANEGYELFKSDGTAAGTGIVKDINPGGPSSIVSTSSFGGQTMMAAAGSYVYFVADDGTHGPELWKTDGTDAGTQMVRDIRPGTSSGNINYLTNVNGTLFFAANDGSFGNELWKSDGTQSGTTVVRDIYPGSFNSWPEYLTNVNGTLYFQALSPNSGWEIWKSDGSSSGTVLVKDLVSGGISSFPSNFVDMGNGKAFFTAYTSSTGYEPWVTDGTSSGTFMLRDVYPGSSSGMVSSFLNRYREIAVVNNIVYFQAVNTAGNYELWKSDGTTTGTQMVVDLYPGTSGSIPEYLVNLNGTLFFEAYDGNNRNLVYRSDGTAAGTTPLLDANGTYVYGSPRRLHNYNGNLTFIPTSAFYSRDDELWVSDGTNSFVQPADLANGGNFLNGDGFVTVGPNLFFYSGPNQELTRFRISEPPTDLTLTPTQVDENSPIGTAIGKFTTVDPDTVDKFTYSLVTGSGDGDNSLFRITNDTLEVNGALDFERRANYSIRARVTDRGGNTFDKVFTITLRDVNEAPSNLFLSGVSVREDAAIGTLVGVLQGFDPDAGSTYTYSLAAGPGDNDNASFSVSGTSLTLAEKLDYEVKSSYSVRLKVADQAGLTFEKAFTIFVSDVNEAPIALVYSGQPVPENQPEGYIVGSFGAVDPDANTAFSFSVVGGSGLGYFGTQGNLLITTAILDYETTTSFDVLVRVSDQGGLFYEKSFTVPVKNLDDVATTIILNPAPVPVPPSTIVPPAGSLPGPRGYPNNILTIPENLPAGTVIANMSTLVPAYGNTLSFSFSSGGGGEDNGQFSIQGGNQLVVNSAFNFEAKNSYNVRVRATDSTGLSFEARYIIYVLDVNEAPFNIVLSNNKINEGQPINSLIGGFTSSDADRNDSATYTLVAGPGGQDNGAFNLRENVLRSSATFNFQAKSSYSIRIRATDLGGLSQEQVFTIRIGDIADPIPMYRAYNPIADYHFFTTSRTEFDNAIRAGYRDEWTGKVSFMVMASPIEGATPIFRLYNLQTGRHYYTSNEAEKNALVAKIPPSNPSFGKVGWRYEKTEGYIFTSQVDGTVPVYRLYNTTTGTHLYTESGAAKDTIIKQYTGRWEEHAVFGYAYVGLPGAFTGGNAPPVNAPLQSPVVEPASPSAAAAAPIASAVRVDTLIATSTTSAASGATDSPTVTASVPAISSVPAKSAPLSVPVATETLDHVFQTALSLDLVD